MKIFQGQIALWSTTGFVCGDSKFNFATLRFVNGPLSDSGNFGQRHYISYPESRIDTFGNEFRGVEFNMGATLKIKQPIASWCPMSSWVKFVGFVQFI